MIVLRQSTTVPNTSNTNACTDSIWLIVASEHNFKSHKPRRLIPAFKLDWAGMEQTPGQSHAAVGTSRERGAGPPRTDQPCFASADRRCRTVDPSVSPNGHFGHIHLKIKRLDRNSIESAPLAIGFVPCQGAQ